MVIVAIVCNIISIVTSAVVFILSIKMIKRSADLKKATQRMQKMEVIYAKMAREFENLTDAMMLKDIDGADIFYQKLLTLHNEFMAIGKDD